VILANNGFNGRTPKTLANNRVIALDCNARNNEDDETRDRIVTNDSNDSTLFSRGRDKKESEEDEEEESGVADPGVRVVMVVGCFDDAVSDDVPML
jgi:hypothetical protein